MARAGKSGLTNAAGARAATNRFELEPLEDRRLMSVGPVGPAGDAGGASLPAVGLPRVSTSDPAASSSFAASFGSYGLATLSYNGVTLYDGTAHPDDRFQVFASTLIKPGGARVDGSTGGYHASWDALSHTITWSYAWGSVSCQYTVGTNSLGMRVTVSNTSATDTVAGVNVLPLAVRFPTRPAGWDEGGQTTFGQQGPAVVSGDYGSGEVALAAVDQSGAAPLYVGFQGMSTLTITANRYVVRVGTTPLWFATTTQPVFDRPVAPGASASYAVTLRVAPSGSSLTEIAGNVLADYARQHPYQVNWSDRRPISWLFPSGSGPASRSATNPSGWFNDPTVDVTTPAGLAAFRTRLLAYADNAVAMLKSVGGQGMITWDIEGERYDAVKYVGDPRLAETLSPELAYQDVLDAYFKKFTDAGLRVGVCIRPQQVVMQNGVPVTQADVADVAGELTAKIQYAKQRWGATLFYIDSTDPRMDATVLGQVAAACPGVLLIPENKNVGSYQYAAPYDELRRGTTGTPASVRATYPQAFSVIATGGVDNIAALEGQLKASVARGDILLFDGWYNAPDVAVVRDIYRSLSTTAPGAPATTTSTSSATGATTPAARTFSNQAVSALWDLKGSDDEQTATGWLAAA